MDSPNMQKMMGQLLPHIPKLLSVLSSAPAIAFGYIMIWIWCLFFVGTTSFRETVAPVAGFHIVALTILKRMLKCYNEGRVAASALRQRKESVRSFAKDIKLMSHGPKLD